MSYSSLCALEKQWSVRYHTLKPGDCTQWNGRADCPMAEILIHYIWYSYTIVKI
jgi:hypothetical protein